MITLVSADSGRQDADFSDRDWECFVYWLAGISPVDLFAFKLHQLERRLAIRREVAGFERWSDYRQFLQKHPQNLERLLQSLTISVSSFFRDPVCWQALETDLKTGSAPLRAWSVGCAGGQELYSLAICLDRIGRLEGSHLLGSDCSKEAIDQAQKAEYLISRNEPLSSSLLPYMRWLDQGRFCLDERLRQTATFRCEDLFRRTIHGRWDLILCRNLLIYLNGTAQVRLLRRLSQSLPIGGILFIGRSEWIARPQSLGLHPVSRCIYRKVEI
ncbi:CheR family methyltransferase [Gloeobacter kilaueensis]|uniref:MCP methyltransferase, CheR-type n=1 Tax=Gloeobacter kilaueensis (strain ATCC BAA-2537 / CCAP 1431/1 / ULC 316 / JS1) TaxID=1183438 RepID=U5QNC9_GLOK1|nr:CheR family methyltransferase [Gloeobacter kilaueensis]AGY60368.1 MCP methyltransferase, CheR-type [Gloeobacter kilaueensis JS1]